MPQLSPKQVVAGYQAATTAIRDRVLAYTAAVWSGSPSFRDADVDRIVARIVPVIRAGQLQVANLTDAYIGRMAVLSGVAWSPGVDASLTGFRGVPADVVYRRPAVQTYTALSEGKTFADAVEQGAARLQSIVATDIQQVKNRQAQRSVGGSGFTFFRRELTGRENCALCVIASTQRYHRGDLLPIHPACDCDVVPYQAGRDPGQVIDPDLLESTHDEIAARLGRSELGARDLGLDKADAAGRPLSDYTDLIVSRDHGELGPTLTWRSDHFTSADDIARIPVRERR